MPRYDGYFAAFNFGMRVVMNARSWEGIVPNCSIHVSKSIKICSCASVSSSKCLG